METEQKHLKRATLITATLLFAVAVCVLILGAFLYLNIQHTVALEQQIQREFRYGEPTAWAYQTEDFAQKLGWHTDKRMCAAGGYWIVNYSPDQSGDSTKIACSKGFAEKGLDKSIYWIAWTRKTIYVNGEIVLQKKSWVLIYNPHTPNGEGVGRNDVPKFAGFTAWVGEEKNPYPFSKGWDRPETVYEPIYWWGLTQEQVDKAWTNQAQNSYLDFLTR